MTQRRKLTTNSLTSTEGVALQVDDVYVPLGLIERKKPSKYKDNVYEKNDLNKAQSDVSPEQGSELYKETEITKTFEHDAFLEEVIKQKNTPKSKGKRIAIIGEPGAGKTTLLQQIANWISREIPQSIVIWVSLAELPENELKAYLLESWLTQVAEKIGKSEVTKQLKADFVALFKRNNVWLLLDGLDEMSASNPITEIARQFREAGLISQARIVLTCRVNLWDGSINALDDFDIYRTLNFSYPLQVERFIHKWFASSSDNGKRLCNELKKPGKERIQDLIKNPLRLTLLCLNWQSGDGKLPETQAELYQQFVDDFYKWKKEEIVINSRQREQLNIKLGELAKAAIDKEENRFRLRQDFVSQFLGDADDETSLLKLALNRGWLNCVGIDTKRKPVYAFFHASFQEYFAAKAINNWHFFLDHVPNNPQQGTYRIFEPQWKQTILLWLGREEGNLKQQKQQFLNALISFKDGCGTAYQYRAYFLAAAGIAEYKDYFKSDEIVNQIVKWTTDSSSLIQEEAKSTLQQTDRTKAIAALLQLLQSSTVGYFTCKRAASSLETIGVGNEKAIATLIQLLQSSTVSDDTRRQAASSLGKIGAGNEKAIAALEQLLQSSTLDEDILLGIEAASSLGTIDPGNEKAIVTLEQLLYFLNLSFPTTVINIASSLGKIDPGNKNAIAALVQLLQSSTLDNSELREAASSLETIGVGNKNAIAALVQLLQSSTVNDFTRQQAASSLGKIDPGNEKAIAALVQLLQSSTVNDFTREQAASSLETIGVGNKKAIAALVQVLQSSTVNDFTRELVASSLGKIDPGNEKAIAALVQVLQSSTVNDFTRRQAASSLGRIGVGNEKAIAALVQLLQSSTVDDSTRENAASSLGRIGAGNEKAIAALVQLLQSSTVSDDTRIEAALSLEQILQNNKHRAEVVKVLSSYWLLSYWLSNGDYYDLTWQCAQNMPYPDFYQAWHHHNIATRMMRMIGTLKQFLFTMIYEILQ